MHSSNSINGININPFFPFIPHKEDEDSFFLQRIHDLLLRQPPPPPPVVAANPQPPSIEEDQEQIVRSSWKKKKKDRHSKINTAKGPRDRRMRLSLDIARRFFDLQDLLGFDKASRTVEWLLSKSSAAIQELSGSPAGFIVVSPHNQGSANSTTSECEVVSKSSGNAKEKKTNSNFARKSAFDLVTAKESRKAARERAKERTREKIRTSVFDHDQVIRPVKNNLDAISLNNHHLELQLLQDPSSASIIFNYEYDDDHQNLHGIPQQNYEDWDCCQNMGDLLQQHKPMLTWFNN